MTTGTTHVAGWGAGQHHPPWAWRRLAAMVAVGVTHAALVLTWLHITRPATPSPTASPPALTWLTLPPPVAAPAPNALPARAAPRRMAAAPSLQAPRPLPATAAPAPVPDEAGHPAVVGATPAPALPPERPSTLRLLDSAATRHALHELARQPLLAERAASATQHQAPTAAQRLADAASQAGHGDCAKGQYTGAGMGLLSLPFLAGAVVSGRCAR